MIKYIFYSIVFGLSTFGLHAQDDSMTSLDLSFDFFSNTNSFGQFNQLATQPNYSPAVTFNHKSGLTASFISNFTANSDTSLENFSEEFDLMLGYYRPIGKYFTVYPSYTRYFFANQSTLLTSAFTDNFSLDAYADYKNILLGGNVSYLLGDRNEWFITSYASYNLSFDHVLFKNSALMIQPEVNLNFGNQTYFNNYLINSFQTNSDSRSKFLSSRRTQLEILALMRNQDLTYEQAVALILLSYTTQEDSYNLSSVGISVPFAYMIGSFTINASVSAYFLTNKPAYITEDYQIFYGLGLVYSFLWD